jgi:hypothetical protein
MRVLAVLLAVPFLLAAASTAAADNHIFDPTLSLTGGTGSSDRDPISDPGPNHPPSPFFVPCGVAVDEDGNVYVASQGGSENGRIDVFDEAGRFVTEIVVPAEPCDLSVDATGAIFVIQINPVESGVYRYVPSTYPPTSGVTYGPPTLIDSQPGLTGLAVNQENGHVFVVHHDHIIEYGSRAEDNLLLNSSIGEGLIEYSKGIVIDPASGDIYVSSVCEGCDPIPEASEHVSVIYVLSSSGELKEEIDGSDLPGGGFNAPFAQLYPAIDVETGELFVDDVAAIADEDQLVYRFIAKAGGGFEYVADPELEDHFYLPSSRIAVSNGPGASTRGTVFVTSGEKPVSHLYAFPPEPEISAPSVSSVAITDISDMEATLHGTVNPNGAMANYRFEYVTDRQYDEAGFKNPQYVGAGVLGAGSQPISVSAVIGGLIAGDIYHVRLIASNHCKPLELEASCIAIGPEAVFAPYPSPLASVNCPNAPLRTGPSALLPECRAYELVSPPDTNGRPPSAFFLGLGSGSFETQLVNSAGNEILFMTVGGSLPGLGGSGVGDGYEALRTETGWVTSLSGPTGSQSQSPLAGGASPDHGFWFWDTGGEFDDGSLVIGGDPTHYLRRPDGTFALLGQGPSGSDSAAEGRWIAADGAHVIFTSSEPLAPEASPVGVESIYDLVAGDLHVVSLLPSGVAPASGSEVSYQGASLDGSAVAFEVIQGGETTLYQRRRGVTVVAAEGAVAFAGLSRDGSRLTYRRAGDLFSFNFATQETDTIGSGGKSVVVNVSADGSNVYFVSPKVLAKGGIAAAPNLYVWDAATQAITFIGVLSPGDVSGVGQTQGTTYGLGQWVESVGPQQSQLVGLANDPSRTTPDGSTIVFESRADLTPYESDGHSQIYRYRLDEGSLICLSCNPTLAQTDGDAHLQIPWAADEGAPTGALSPVQNVTIDGRRVFFQSPEALVATDVDETDDVYEWLDLGTEGCSRPSGCVALISSGHSAGPNYLFAATSSGSDIVFSSSDRLVASDGDSTPSLYDARVNGGFPVTESPSCSGEGCKPQPSVPPSLLSPGSRPAAEGRRIGKRCKKGQRKVKQGGKVRCARKHRSGKRRRAGSGKGGTR